MEQKLPSSVEPATTAGGQAVHAGWLATHHTMCGLPVVGWMPGGRDTITCRACTARLGRYRWSSGDYWPPVGDDELEAAGFLP